MPFVPVGPAGALGIVQDIPSHELPPEAWSDGRNVRFTDEKAVKMDGYSLVFDPPSVAPYWLLSVRSAVERIWLYAGLAKVYAFSSIGHTDITRTSGGDYSATEAGLWNGGVLGGIPILNNGVDDPQYWATANPATTKLADLSNWPASTACAVIRPFKNFLVALDVTKSGVRFPHMVKWSHPAVPGAVPVSWDETDATRDAGENQLTDTESGFIFDGQVLRDIFVIYKEQSTWGMQFIGPPNIFRFFKILEQSGILTKNCVGVLGDGARHFIPTGDDIIVHDGQRAESVIERSFRKTINTLLDVDTFGRSFVVRNSVDNELWFCFPESGQTWPNLAFVWNYRDGSQSIRDIASASHIAAGEIVESDTQTWDSDSQVWDADPQVWDFLKHRAQQARLIQADPVASKLYFLDDTNQANGSNITSYIERTGLAIIGRDRRGNAQVDFERRKLVTRLRPKARGGAFQVRVGSQEDIDGTVTWQSPVTFTPGTDQYVDVSVSGRLIAVRFESLADVAWQLDGYDIEVELLGRY